MPFNVLNYHNEYAANIHTSQRERGLAERKEGEIGCNFFSHAKTSTKTKLTIHAGIMNSRENYGITPT